MQDILNQKGDAKTCTSAVIIRDGKILLGLRHYTPDKFKKVSLWVTPGGRCDDGECLEDTIRREVEEETGIRELDLKQYLGLVKGVKLGDDVHIFHCESEGEAKLMEPHKFSEWRWFAKDEIPENFINNDCKELFCELL